MEGRMPKFDGAITTTGTSEAIRLEKAFFKAHPEFKQKSRVHAQVIAPGQVLVSVVRPMPTEPEDDPVVLAYLRFLERDIETHPERLVPFDADRRARIEALTKDVIVSDDDVIPDDVTL
jgi:antitoxin PrlF